LCKNIKDNWDSISPIVSGLMENKSLKYKMLYVICLIIEFKLVESPKEHTYIHTETYFNVLYITYTYLLIKIFKNPEDIATELNKFYDSTFSKFSSCDIESFKDEINKKYPKFIGIVSTRINSLTNIENFNSYINKTKSQFISITTTQDQENKEEELTSEGYPFSKEEIEKLSKKLKKNKKYLDEDLEGLSEEKRDFVKKLNYFVNKIHMDISTFSSLDEIMAFLSNISPSLYE